MMYQFPAKKNYRPCLRISPHKVGLFMIGVVLLWGVFLFNSTQWKTEIKESEVLKSKIVELSKEYINVLAKEKGSLAEGSESYKTAVLLQNMLSRIDQLEDQLQKVITNSTTSFARMVNAIQRLNKTILVGLNGSVSTYEIVCEIPADVKGYPHCKGKVDWMKNHWESDPKFAKSGVNGTVCSFLEYLSNVEDHCPKNYIRSQKWKTPLIEEPSGKKAKEDNCMKNIGDRAFPSCKAKVEWMKKYWKSDPMYASLGVDGSVCSIVSYLSEYETWCPLMAGRHPLKGDCKIPKTPEFPNCGDKIAWMRKFWKSDPCYVGFGVNGTVCSFIVYLSEVERWCPLQPGRHTRQINRETSSAPTYRPDLSQTKVENLLAILQSSGKTDEVKYSWMSTRIQRLWSDWTNGVNALNKRVKLDGYDRKKILIYIGLLGDEKNYHFGEQATKGGPLGELVQWSDLITALYVLGHDLKISLKKTGLKDLLKSSVSGLCPSTKRSEFDIIYTDYIGLSHIIRVFKNINSLKCHLRIVDSFGTEAQFNTKLDNSKNLYGYHNLNLKQYNTMFPHSPDNSFLGFIVENHLKPGEVLEKKKRIALVYGKHISMWQDHKKIAFLDLVQKYFEVHATVGGTKDSKSKVKYVLPSYVINHGVMKGADLQKLLRETTLFVGLGFPYEGPAPLEAIANGAFFLNVKLVPPLGKSNNKFFKQKPTERKLTSQHPYAERFIGKPHVYTVDVNNLEDVENALKDMETKVAEPYLPYEFTYEGMLERLYMFTKHQDFCTESHGSGNVSAGWPPISAKQVFMGGANQGCDDVCEKQGLVCEPAYFPFINDKTQLPHCASATPTASIVAPALKLDKSNNCLLQANKLLYSCTAKSPSAKRLCPCRDYVRGQTAFCKNCLDGLR